MEKSEKIMTNRAVFALIAAVFTVHSVLNSGFLNYDDNVIRKKYKAAFYGYDIAQSFMLELQEGAAFGADLEK
ncbi:MAG: hypothetical protein LBQ47_00745 [Endomicrobium sp.]|jgi:hypothetical protein|nr:hypothetical protein [Endomicrobium sp.]